MPLLSSFDDVIIKFTCWRFLSFLGIDVFLLVNWVCKIHRQQVAENNSNKFESDWYFCNITKSGWFWKRLFKMKVLINHFLKSLQKQAYGDVLQNRFFRNFPIFTGKHLCWSFFLIKLQAYFNTCVSLWILRNFLIVNLRWHLSIFSS